jgi:hypothetical protein
MVPADLELRSAIQRKSFIFTLTNIVSELALLRLLKLFYQQTVGNCREAADALLNPVSNEKPVGSGVKECHRSSPDMYCSLM